jgi:hypothetical protein
MNNFNMSDLTIIHEKTETTQITGFINRFPFPQIQSISNIVTQSLNDKNFLTLNLDQRLGDR